MVDERQPGAAVGCNKEQKEKKVMRRRTAGGYGCREEDADCDLWLGFCERDYVRGRERLSLGLGESIYRHICMSLGFCA